MKQHYFIKFDPRIKRLTGCDRATLILEKIEYFFSKMPNGFYKFIEPCEHRLYKRFDSWSEELGCDRKCFTRAWERIAFRHKSRRAFEEAIDKFEGKLYASFYDRNRNQMFFIRNHELANETLKEFYKPKKSKIKKDDTQAKKTSNSLASEPLRNGHSDRSYKDVKNTPSELSEDNSHASNGTEKEMLEIWTALVEEGIGKIELTHRRIAFLKQAFKDKFDSCLEKWKKYCQDIASSRFLMGEIKSSFRASLDWALKFDVIQKILEGNYGIGDRRPSTVPSAAESFLKNSKIEIASEEAGIEKATDEPEIVREFRLKWLNKFGASTYRECLKDCAIEVGDDATLILRPSSRYNAKSISSYWTPTLLVASPFTKAHIVQHEGDLVFDKWFLLEPGREGTLPEHEGLGVKASSDLTAAPMPVSLPEVTNIVAAAIEKPSQEPLPCEAKESGVVVTQVTSETRMLRKKLRESMPHNQFPTWLGSIEVEEVARDGSVIVTFEDSFAVGWSRTRFSKEIFQVVASLWKGVNKLIIRQKEGYTVPLSIENPSRISENVTEKSTLEQAIQSLLSVCSPKLVETFGLQGFCQTFGRSGAYG